MGRYSSRQGLYIRTYSNCGCKSNRRMVHRSSTSSGGTQHSLQYSISNRGFGIWNVLCHLAINKARVKIWDLRATIFKVHALVCMLKYLALIKRRFWLQNLQLGGDIFIQFLSSLEQIYVHLSFLTLIMLIFFCWPFGVRICQINVVTQMFYFRGRCLHNRGAIWKTKET